MTISYLESERALIGALLTGCKDTQEWAASELLPRDFYDHNHQRLWKALQLILDEGLEVSQVSVKDRSKANPGAVEACLEAGQGLAPSQLKTLVKDIHSA